MADQSKFNTKRAQLDALGFCDPDKQADAIWDARLAELAAFQKIHGHCEVVTGSRTNPGLGIWVAHQIRDYLRGRLTPEQLARLAALNLFQPADEFMFQTRRKG